MEQLTRPVHIQLHMQCSRHAQLELSGSGAGIQLTNNIKVGLSEELQANSFIHALMGCYVEVLKGAPSEGVGADEHAEDLLAGPQLHGLDDGGDGQVGGGEGVPHEGHQAPHVCARVEPVLAGQQVSRRQKILHRVWHQG